MSKAAVDKILDAVEPESKEELETTESSDSQLMTYIGKKITTVDELLESANVDLRIWEVVEATVNNWEVGGKRKMGRGNPDSLWKTGLRQIKVKLRRKAPKVVQDGIRLLIDNWKPFTSSKPPAKRRGDKSLIVVSLNDIHFGKRAWAPESGDDYDLPIAVKTWDDGFDDLLTKSTRFAPNIDEIWFPVGNDFFHVNDWSSRTVNETRVDSVDDRFPKVFEAGATCVMNSIKRLSEIAPVKVIWVPGNHDFHTSWHLSFALEMAFGNSGIKHVTIDRSLRARKYHKYGITVVGFCHGEKVKEVKLPTLMSSEARELLTPEVKFREWHLGHLHISRETEFRTEDSLPNTTIRRLPSLCATDGWHDQMGFVDSYKMAEALVYSRERGPEAKFITHAKA